MTDIIYFSSENMNQDNLPEFSPLADLSYDLGSLQNDTYDIDSHFALCNVPSNETDKELTFCLQCSARLQYPKNSKYIQCPKCYRTMEMDGARMQRSPSPQPLDAPSDPLAPWDQISTALLATPGSPSGEDTVYCGLCSVELSYPKGSKCIQCPNCQNTMNPAASQKTHCTGCHALLAYPPNSLYIQCPTCFATMNSRDLTPFNSNPSPLIVPSSPSRKGKQLKKRRDPHAPKAASNAYMIFCKEYRSNLRTQYPELPFGQVGAKLGEIWREMTTEQKKPYEDRASSDRQRYRQQMVQYQIQNQHDIVKKRRQSNAENLTVETIT